MSTETNKAIVRQHWELFNRRDPKQFDLFTEDVILHDVPVFGAVRSNEAQKQLVAQLFGAFPDMQGTVEGDIIAEGDRVAFRVTLRGTHQGPLPGIPATGKQGAMKGMRIWRFADGKIAEVWSSDDMLGMLQQLGVIPAAGQA